MLGPFSTLAGPYNGQRSLSVHAAFLLSTSLAPAGSRSEHGAPSGSGSQGLASPTVGISSTRWAKGSDFWELLSCLDGRANHTHLWRDKRQNACCTAVRQTPRPTKAPLPQNTSEATPSRLPPCRPRRPQRKEPSLVHRSTHTNWRAKKTKRVPGTTPHTPLPANLNTNTTKHNPTKQYLRVCGPPVHPGSITPGSSTSTSTRRSRERVPAPRGSGG